MTEKLKKAEGQYQGDKLVSESVDAEGPIRITFVRIFDHPHWGWEIEKVERRIVFCHGPGKKMTYEWVEQ